MGVSTRTCTKGEDMSTPSSRKPRPGEEGYELPDISTRVGSLRSGIDWELEEEATRILKQDRKDRGVTKQSEKRDWLTPVQLEHRLSKEIYTSVGVPDKGLFQGIYRRAYNPNIGKRPNPNIDYDNVE